MPGGCSVRGKKLGKGAAEGGKMAVGTLGAAFAPNEKDHVLGRPEHEGGEADEEDVVSRAARGRPLGNSQVPCLLGACTGCVSDYLGVSFPTRLA